MPEQQLNKEQESSTLVVGFKTADLDKNILASILRLWNKYVDLESRPLMGRYEQKAYQRGDLSEEDAICFSYGIRPQNIWENFDRDGYRIGSVIDENSKLRARSQYIEGEKFVRFIFVPNLGPNATLANQLRSNQITKDFERAYVSYVTSHLSWEPMLGETKYQYTYKVAELEAK